ncbi:DUF4079 domain-containing protein [Limnoraphis robusta Tam1]|uniref:DUF4079 domain-containing protein n=1 Tax=Limnoraphis robusta TaxID=1118279 RepID=UPI002B1F729B|nr:DUF4079 domain-containing protein [Limnoraphis robusta]MEA5537879.1 DUF4079 domain-containing protein [Limnoraphis robusta Tam1]
MNTIDIMALLHPALAVGIVFPIIGMVVSRAWQTRQRRIETQENKQKSKIPPTVGREHLEVGRWLTSSVVGVTLIAIAYSIYFKGVFKELTPEKTPQAILILLIFAVTIASLVFLYKAKPSQPLWRGVFATLTGIGLVILGSQDGVFRRGYEWYVSHYYFGMIAALLMVISLAIVPEIYKNKKWRIAHTALNCIALLLFFGQGITGARDLLEIPLSWQQQHLYQCDWNNKTCPSQQSQILEVFPTQPVNLSQEERDIRPQ